MDKHILRKIYSGIKSLSFLLFFTILTGCEVSLDDNFINIEPPTVSDVVIDLDALMDDETIIIYKRNTTFKYTLQAFGKEVTKVEISMNGSEWTDYSDTGYIYTDSYRFPNGEYTLRFRYYLKSGNGSIADQLDLEHLEGSKEWKVKVCYDLPPEMQDIEMSISEEGFLQLSWEKPSYRSLQFISYSIYENNDLISTIQNADEVTFVYKSHVFDGNQSFLVVANFEDDIKWNIASGKMPDDGFILQRDYENDTKEMIAVKWSNKYKCKWNIYVNDVLRERDTEMNNLTLPITQFGVDDYNLRIEPIPYYTEDRTNYTLAKSILVGSPGIQISKEYMTVAYSLTEDVFYYTGNDSLYCRTLPDFKIHSSVKMPGSDVYTNAKIPNVLLKTDLELRLYDGKDLNLLNTYKLDAGDEIIEVNLLNNGNVFVSTFRMQGARTIMQYGIILDQNLKLKKKILLYNGTSIYNTAISPDGKYLCAYSPSTIYINKLSVDFEIIEQSEYQTNEGRIVGFSYLPDNSSQFIAELHQYEAAPFRLIIYNTEDFSIAHEYERGVAFRGFDIKNDLMCIYKNEELVAVNRETSEELFSVPSYMNHFNSMHAGVLFSTAGYVYNINKYLK